MPVDHIFLGHYRMALVKGGVQTPCAITMEENAAPVLYLNGLEYKEKVTDWMLKVTMFGTPIPEWEFRYMSDKARWAEKNAPDSPIANPWKRIDLRNMKPLF